LEQIEPVIICYSAKGKVLAGKIARKFDAQLLCSPSKQMVQQAFSEGTPIIGICATGILIRILAPLLNDKFNEAPVIVISSDGENIVPLLGAHHGANELAQELADILLAKIIKTSASDRRFTRSLDEPPRGYVLADANLAKNAMKKVLAGEKVLLNGEADWLSEAGYELNVQGEVEITISEEIANKNTLTYHPKTLIIGVGAERNAPTNELIGLVENTLKTHNLSPLSIAAIASIDVKADEKAINELATHFNVPLRLFTADSLAREQVPNPSKIVKAEVGTSSVAEASAIKAGELIVEKQKSKRTTCAIGKAALPIDIENFGVARGILHIVGIGPGEHEQRTISAIGALKNSSDWVAYGFYLDLIADLKRAQTEHRFPLGDEEKRVRHALELAAKGKEVALICSGDGQIYAMASLVFELLDASGKRAISKNAKRVEIISHAGISALQMASNRVGAILGHDFCAISLSDLLTPKKNIIERLEGAAKADFVTAFYNPRSKTRTDLLDRAKEIFLEHRPPTTPVIIARSLGRKDEAIKIVELKDFNPCEVDMMSIVLFGSTNSKSFMRGDGRAVAYTPRGYAGKVETE